MRICFFGESYVNGTGDPAFQGWVGRLCAHTTSQGHDITAYNCGIRGATSALIRETWLAEATARLPADQKCAVVFSYGTNDCWRENNVPRVTLEAQLDNTFAILKAATARWTTLFVGPPGLPVYAAQTMREADHAERCARIQTLCAELEVPYFDTLAVYARFTHWRTEALAHDGAHPGAAGYTEMAEALTAWPPWHKMLQAAS